MLPSATSNNIHRSRCKNVLKVAPSKLAVNESAYYNECKKRKGTLPCDYPDHVSNIEGMGEWCILHVQSMSGFLEERELETETERQRQTDTDREKRKVFYTYNGSRSKETHTHTHTKEVHILNKFSS